MNCLNGRARGALARKYSRETSAHPIPLLANLAQLNTLLRKLDPGFYPGISSPFAYDTK